MDELADSHGPLDAIKPFLADIRHADPPAEMTPAVFQGFIAWLDRNNAWPLVAPDFPLPDRTRIRWSTPFWLLPEALRRDSPPEPTRLAAIRQALATIKIADLFRSSPLGYLSDRLSDAGVHTAQQLRRNGRGWSNADWSEALTGIIRRKNLGELGALLRVAGPERALGLILAHDAKTALSHWLFLQAAVQNTPLAATLSQPCRLGTVLKRGSQSDFPT